ncbi:g12636 [Coccomyxa viridis]|uniref:G12636 protein n=1 Tax=Coccomyxa viridis TaxID=1274662 RepID=A0ABP1GDF7_9CHLO
MHAPTLLSWDLSGRASRRLPKAGLTEVQANTTSVQSLVRWLIEVKGLPPQRADVTGARPDGSWTAFTNQDIKAGEAVVELPSDLSITAVDVAAHETVASLAEGHGELTGLALWLLAERQKGEKSEWAPFLITLPDSVPSPVFWAAGQQEELLRGSPVLKEAKARATALQKEWSAIQEKVSADPGKFDPGVYTSDRFRAALSVVLAYAVYLPSAKCFVLLPLLSQVQRSGDESAAVLDYDIQNERVTLTAEQPCRQGEAVTVFDGRPNTELILATGRVEEDSPSDYLTISVGLVQADRMYSTKQEILKAMGFEGVQEFPVYRERMPMQLLSYLRLARLTDSALLAKVTFDKDVILSPANEYEVLSLLLGECKTRLGSYAGTAEDDVKLLQQRDLSAEERLAARLRLAEKRVLQSTLDAVRRRLAPIRGVPTKSGKMTDPNADLLEIFDAFESVPKLPSKLFGGLMSWARGEQDPDWKKKTPPR